MKTAMATIITTTCLVGVLASTTAAPRQATAPTQPTTELTLEEQECEVDGQKVFVWAQGRDQGLSLLQAIQISRQVARQMAARYGANAEKQAREEAIIRSIYELRTVSPTRIRHYIEAQCLQRVHPLDGAPMVPDARLRY